jgi:Bardet-Biedl syndrome 7 protein
VQPRQLEYLHGIVKDLFIDYHKFKGTNVKAKVPQLDQVLRDYNLDELIAFVTSPH